VSISRSRLNTWYGTVAESCAAKMNRSAFFFLAGLRVERTLDWKLGGDLLKQKPIIFVCHWYCFLNKGGKTEKLYNPVLVIICHLKALFDWY